MKAMLLIVGGVGGFGFVANRANVLIADRDESENYDPVELQKRHIEQNEAIAAHAVVARVTAEKNAEYQVMQTLGIQPAPVPAQLPPSMVPVQSPAQMTVETVQPVAAPEPIEQVQSVTASHKVESPNSDMAVTASAAPDEAAAMGTSLIENLAALGYHAILRETYIGPSVNQYLVKLGDATKANKVLNCSKALQIQMELEYEPTISIEKGLVAFSIVREVRTLIRFKDWVKKDNRPGVYVPIGVNVRNQLIELKMDAHDLRSAIVGGVPGGGKSSFICALIGSLAMRYEPSQVQFALFDGKGGVELNYMNGSPFLAKPVAIDSDSATDLMNWVKEEIDRRFELLESAGAQELETYNAKQSKEDKLPYLLAIVDESHDLFDFSKDTPELKAACSSASRGRAAGVMLLFATQRPDRNVIPGQIDAKCAMRVGFQLEKSSDSEMVLGGTKGAENLIGHGDMLYKTNGRIQRLQGILAERSDIEGYLRIGDDDEYGEWQ
jgi:S-DNA-T family DNA segregation ATPase FtsK/SpoIIIE